MAGKLTEEQKAEIERRYLAGESGPVLAQQMGVSANVVCNALRERGVRIRSRSENTSARYGHAGSEKAQWIARYQAGEHSSSIAADARVSKSTILRVLKASGIKPRSLSEARRLIDGPLSVSDERLYQLYIRERRSTREISGMIGDSPDRIRHRLAAMGCKRRSLREAAAVAFESGRRTAVGPSGIDNIPALRQWEAEHQHVVRANLDRAREIRWARSRKWGPCGWCGSRVRYRAHHQRGERQRLCCSHCAGKYAGHMRYRPELPRPLILGLLRSATSSAKTESEIKRIAVDVGAREPEIAEVVLDKMLSVAMT